MVVDAQNFQLTKKHIADETQVVFPDEKLTIKPRLLGWIMVDEHGAIDSHLLPGAGAVQKQNGSN